MPVRTAEEQQQQQQAASSLSASVDNPLQSQIIMALQAFKNAEKKPGLQVWRVENFDLKPIPVSQYGNFYIGDTYILLFRNGCAVNIHSWIGSEATQDESGSGAIFLTQLDEHLGGSPVQFIEFQNEESETFKGYFKSCLKYKKGGVASGFKHVETDETHEVVVMQLKGRRCVRATQVNSSWGPFNSGDCFIIDLGKHIYHWSGCNSNPFERIKTTLMAKDICYNERKGKAEVHMITEGDEPPEVIEALGGPKPDLPPGSCDSEVPMSMKEKCAASLYMISDAAGSVTETLVADKPPFKQDMLCPNECFILDNGGNHTIYVWKGPKASVEERSAAAQAAHKFIKKHNYSCKTQVQILPAGAETTMFKKFFCNWMDKDEIVGPGQTYTVGRIAQVAQISFDSSSLHDNKAMAAQHGMVDDGSGDVQIWRVDSSKEKVPVDPSTYGQFYGGDCYLVQYSYDCGGRTKHIIYYWQGNKCSQDERAISAILTTHLDDSMGGIATQVRVTQGREPAHLVSLFKGKLMIIYLGGTSRCGDQTAAGDTRLFHIRLSSTKATRAVEVDPIASSLNSNDVFVLKTPNNDVIVWKGQGMAEEEMEAAEHMTSVLGGPVTHVDENSEPENFWNALGGKTDYQTSRALQNAVKPPRLFACSNKTGRLIAEEVPGEMTQMDLATDDIMILDVWDMIYMWVGRDANEAEKKGAPEIANDYVNTDPSGRRGIPIVTIKQGEETPCFTGWFQAWDSDMWDRSLQDLISRFSHC